MKLKAIEKLEPTIQEKTSEVVTNVFTAIGL